MGFSAGRGGAEFEITPLLEWTDFTDRYNTPDSMV